MKKIIALLLMAVLVCGCLTGCSSKGKTVDDIKKAGKLVIATSPDFPPFEELQSDGSVQGIEIDILNMICEKLGVKLEIAQMEFEAVIPGVIAGKFDFGVSGITANEDRKKNVAFTDPYCLAAQAIVVTSDSSIAAKADLKDKTIAVQTGTTAETYCMGEGYKFSAYSANSDAELALTTGKVDAWVIDDLTAADMVSVYNAENPDAPLVILSEAMTTEPYALATQLGNDELIAEVNKILNEIVADGTVASLFEKYDAPYTKP